MSSTPLRSFVKGVVWESVAFVMTTAAVYLVYGNIWSSIQFSLVLTVIKMCLFFVHERIWKKIRWGKYHVVNGKVIFESPNRDKKGKKK
jgi:adenylylsulfate kinase